MSTVIISPPSVHLIRNRYGWVVSYIVPSTRMPWDDVTIRRRYRGESCPDMVVSVETARLHYAAQLRAGFKPVINPEF